MPDPTLRNPGIRYQHREDVTESKISTTTLGNAIAGIYSHYPDLSGYTEDEIREMLLRPESDGETV